MVRRIPVGLTLLICAIASCRILPAQTAKTIVVRMLDSRTGHLIVTTNFMVQINHEQTVHGNWVVQNEDGTGKLTLPPNAAVLAAQATYDSGMTQYVNCDSVKDKDAAVARWYAVSDILTTGVAAPNGCNKRTAVAKPGEFTFFVREQNWKEKLQDYTN